MTLQELMNALEKAIDCDGATLNSMVYVVAEFTLQIDDITVDEDKDILIEI